MSSRSNVNISEIATQPGLVLGWGLIGLLCLLLLWFMWPLVIVSGMLGGSYWLWRRQQIKLAQQDRQQHRLNHKFYELLQHRQGRVSALELAMHTRLSGEQARRYLHHQAQALGAYFERTVHGDIIYIFNLAAMYDTQPEMTPAEVAWAYAERERARVQHYRTAQANAKQIQALRQLSQQKSAPKLGGSAQRSGPAPNVLEAQAAIAAQCRSAYDAANETNRDGRASLADDPVVTIDVSVADG